MSAICPLPLPSNDVPTKAEAVYRTVAAEEEDAGSTVDDMVTIGSA